MPMYSLACDEQSMGSGDERCISQTYSRAEQVDELKEGARPPVCHQQGNRISVL